VDKKTAVLCVLVMFLWLPALRGQGNDIELSGNGWRKSAVIVAKGLAITSSHGDTGHRIVRRLPGNDLVLVQVGGRAPAIGPAPTSLDRVYLRGSGWARVTWHFDGLLTLDCRAISGQSGAGLYDPQGRLVGICIGERGGYAVCQPVSAAIAGTTLR